MRDVTSPPQTWEAELTHDRCGTSFTAETGDLRFEEFSKPGTYFFDGSADAAGLTGRFFVECPAGCRDEAGFPAPVFVDDSSVPTLLADRLRSEYFTAQRRQ